MPSFLLLVLFLACVCRCEEDVNYENIRRFMSQSPEDLAKTLQLLENPYIAAALVNSNRKTTSKKPAPGEESNNLLNLLLTQGMRRTYKIENPPLPLVPPVVDARGIENDPLLGSFFQDTKEDQPPLENAKNKDVPVVEYRKMKQAKAESQRLQQKSTSFEAAGPYYYVPPEHFHR